MIPDAECVKIMAEILSDLKLGSFAIKVQLYVYDIWASSPITVCPVHPSTLRSITVKFLMGCLLHVEYHQRSSDPHALRWTN